MQVSLGGSLWGGCRNVTGTQRSGEGDSRGVAGAIGDTVSKGLC